jgi:sugar (pentulose or hexulose) kinase
LDHFSIDHLVNLNSRNDKKKAVNTRHSQFTMNKTSLIGIFDIGKTNKKLFLFDEQYRVVFEKKVVLPETKDEDGFPCEDSEALCSFINESFHEMITYGNVDIKAINFSAYGASFMYVGEEGRPVAPLYNYLKPYPGHLLRQFYDMYGGEENFAYQAASPVLGSLNSGMQLYRIKYERPELFKKIKYAFHLPQYLSYLICGGLYSDITSIGCHTNLWDFKKNRYHEWVEKEGILEKLLPIASSDKIIPSVYAGHNYNAGIGLHDSSAALIPYLLRFNEPFVLISTGTWCISLNPFNHIELTPHELKNDCLCYLQFNGKPAKAARLFAGHVHDQQVHRIAEYFQAGPARYRDLAFNIEIMDRLQKNDTEPSLQQCAFEKRELSVFSTGEEAYHQLLSDLIAQQTASVNLVLEKKKVKKIFVDGGFSKNEIYMNLLALAFPGMEVCAASMAQATAVGAALVIHKAWNKNSIPRNIITLKPYPPRLEKFYKDNI